MNENGYKEALATCLKAKYLLHLVYCIQILIGKSFQISFDNCQRRKTKLIKTKRIYSGMKLDSVNLLQKMSEIDYSRILYS